MLCSGQMTCPTCDGSRRVTRPVERKWWEVILGRPSQIDELCERCSGIGAVKGSAEEEEADRKRTRLKHHSYEIPEEIEQGAHSPAFTKFLRGWFLDTYAITHGELDITFLKELTPEELETARELIRRNLKTRYTHIVEGASALHDVEAAPILREMLDKEPEESRRLTMAGALWKIAKDPVFIDCLERAKASNGSLVSAHLHQVLWLDDERAIDFLIDLLDHREWLVQAPTLSLLNQLESGLRVAMPVREMPHQPDDYRRRRNDPALSATSRRMGCC